MKKIILISSLAIILALIADVCFSKTNETAVTKITLKPEPNAQNEMIENIGVIDKILSVGKYAWAFGSDKETDKVAFYNGASWSSGVDLNGYIKSFLPDYPISGKTPGAWFLLSHNLEDFISYFDGNSWSPPILVSNLLGMQDNEFYSNIYFYGIGGYVFLLTHRAIEGNFLTYTIYNPTTKTWLPPKSMEYTSKGLGAELYMKIIADESNPRLLIGDVFINEDYSGKKVQFYEITKEGEIKSDPTVINLDADVERIRVSKDVVTIVSRGDRFIYKNINSDNQWNYPDFNLLSNGMSYKYADNHQLDKLICVAFNSSPYYLINCVDTASSAVKFKQQIIDSVNFGSKMKMRPNGAWILHYTDGLHITDYDFNANTKTDTNFPKPYRYIQMRAVDSGILLVCEPSVVSNIKPTLRYYDRTKLRPQWLDINNNNIQAVQCNFSQPYNITEIKEEETVWLYNTKR